ncbi:hypothetical protein GCM10027425_22930 [Alteromonas gracilis]
MRWEDSVLALIDDLEQQAAGLDLRARDAEVDDLRVGEYAEVTLASRWHASVGARVRVDLLGGVVVQGAVLRTGPDWALVDESGREVLLRLAAVRQVQGLSPRSVAPETLGVVRRLGVRSVLRRLVEEGADALWLATDGSRVECRLMRVGADFVEVRLAQGAAILSTQGLAAVVAR